MAVVTHHDAVHGLQQVQVHLRIPGANLLALGCFEAAVVLVEVMVLRQVQPRKRVLRLGVGPLEGTDTGQVARQRHDHHVHHEGTDQRNLAVGLDVDVGAHVGARAIGAAFAGAGVVARSIDLRRHLASGRAVLHRREPHLELTDFVEVLLQHGLVRRAQLGHQ